MVLPQHEKPSAAVAVAALVALIVLVARDVSVVLTCWWIARYHPEFLAEVRPDPVHLFSVHAP
jgi:hypothetical protein